MFGAIGKLASGAWKKISNPGDTAFGRVTGVKTGDSKDYDYGGSPEYAAQMRQHLSDRAGQAQGRQAYQLDRSSVDNAMGQQTDAMRGQAGALANERNARAAQNEALGMYRDAALGRGPSVAAAQQQQGLEDASRMGQNLAAGAVGANPLLAASNAASASADAARRSTTAAAQMRAQEISDARQGFAGLTGQMRQGDLARGQAYLDRGQSALGAGQFAFGAEQAQGGLEMQQRGMNDLQEQAFQGFLGQMNQAALQGRMGYGNAQLQASQANAANSLAKRGQNQQFFGDLMKAAGGAATGGAM